jgi:hypothetical protein
MLWHITLTHKRIGLPSTPLVKRFAVVADDPHSAEEIVLREAGEPRERVITIKTNACQSGIIRIR